MAIWVILFATFGCQEKKQDNLPMAIEIMGESNGLDKVLEGLDAGTYSWKDHKVIFGDFSVEKLTERLTSTFPDARLKTYTDPVYRFSKKLHCENGQEASEWKHYLLTANLVENPTLQQEYLDYHETQFEEWPEVAAGFCNADFQQLLVYKTGRQLLLVISVPADKTLDELNPKTTENNPRVDEWNAKMGIYQEGIEGTEPGEVWVFLEEN